MATLPPPDVAMDMSSPAQHMYQDSDIEIDLEDYPVGVELTEDERMLEDADQARPDTATDENMDEGDVASVTHEEVMMEEPYADGGAGEYYDDDLIDYDDNDEAIVEADESQEVHADTAVSTEHVLEPVPEVFVEEADAVHAQQAISATRNSATSTEAVANPLANQSADAAPEDLTERDSVHVTEHTSQTTLAAPEAQAQPQAASASEADEVEAKAEIEEHAEEHAEEPADSVVNHAQVTDDKEAIEENVTDDTAYHDSDTLQVETSVDKKHSPREAPPTPSDTGLHPVRFDFRQSTYALFKSKSEPNGLLEDDNLASVSLSELMARCREKLCLINDEPVSDVREISLHFAFLEATLSEYDSRAFEFSLKEIIDVYMHLQQNDDVDDVPAMLVTCQLEYNFATTLKYLRHAANQGYGMESLEYMKSCGVEALQTATREEAAIADPDSTSRPDAEYEDEVEGEGHHHEEVEDDDTHGDHEAEEFSEGDAAGTAVVPAIQQDSLHGATLEDVQTKEAEGHTHGSAHGQTDATTTLTADGQPSGDEAANNELDVSGQPPGSADKPTAAPSPATTATLQDDTEEESASVPLHADVGNADVQSTEQASEHSNPVEDEPSSIDHVHDEQQFPEDSQQTDEAREKQVDHASGSAEETSAVDDADVLDGSAFDASYEFGVDGGDYDAAEGEDLNESAHEVDEAPAAYEAKLEPEAAPPQQPAHEDDLLEYDNDELGEPEYEDTAETSAGANIDHHDDEAAEDGIDFEDDEYLTVEAVPANIEKSPRSKRRLEENDEFDSIDFADDEPDIKKARAD